MLKQYKNLFDINETKASELFLECDHPFEVYQVFLLEAFL